MPNRFRQVEVQYREWQKRKETDLKIEALRDKLEALAIECATGTAPLTETYKLHDIVAIGRELAELREAGNR